MCTCRKTLCKCIWAEKTFANVSGQKITLQMCMGRQAFVNVYGQKSHLQMCIARKSLCKRVWAVGRKSLFKCKQWSIPITHIRMEPKIGFHLLFIYGQFCSGIFIAWRKLCKFYQWVGDTGVGWWGERGSGSVRHNHVPAFTIHHPLHTDLNFISLFRILVLCQFSF